jgi:DNA-binding transcriptional MerR regulator
LTLKGSDFYALLVLQPVKLPAFASPPLEAEASEAETTAHKGLRGRRTSLLTTGDMARLSSSTVRTVRFYEETGVLQPAHRSDGGHRLFPATELDKLLFVLDMRNAGLSLEEIKAILGLKHAAGSGESASELVLDVLSRHVTAMNEKIAALSRLRDDFTRAAVILGACKGCNGDPRFPTHCGSCEVMGVQREGLPLTVRVLWDVTEDDAPPPRRPPDDR